MLHVQTNLERWEDTQNASFGISLSVIRQNRAFQFAICTGRVSFVNDSVVLNESFEECFQPTASLLVKKESPYSFNILLDVLL